MSNTYHSAAAVGKSDIPEPQMMILVALAGVPARTAIDDTVAETVACGGCLQ